MIIRMRHITPLAALALGCPASSSGPPPMPDPPPEPHLAPEPKGVGELPPPKPATPEASDCRPTGCSGTVCAAEDVMTTCEYRPEYECYKTAVCERQGDECGWRDTPELKACLEEKKASAGP